jgi:hypothetical protein
MIIRKVAVIIKLKMKGNVLLIRIKIKKNS